MFFTYVLLNYKSNKIYIGYTADLCKRINKHNGINFEKDKKSYTYKISGLWGIIYLETFNTKSEAMSREKQLKSSRGRYFIKTKILAQLDRSVSCG